MTVDLVLLPGHMCDKRLWRDVDFGERPLHHADLTIDDGVEAMADRVLQDAPERFVAIGFSMGGIVAMHLAARAADRLRGLVLLDTNATADLPDRSAARQAQQAHVRAGGLRQVVAEELKPSYLSPANRSRRDILDLTMDMAMALGPEVFIRQSEALRRRPDARVLLPAITATTLVVCGADDQLCPPAWHEAVAAALPQAELEVIPAAGHLLPLEAPVPLTAVLSDFIDRVEGGFA
jgi:pimeloyl-ACP methyl ester carboxylesterase